MKTLYSLSFVAILMASCSMPRSVIESGAVTPKGTIRGGYTNNTYIPTAFVQEVYDGVEAGLETYQQKDTVEIDQTFNDLTEALVAYSLDPLTNSSEFYLRYGLIKNLDLGIKYAGVWAFDAQYQFLGGSKPKGIDASIGIQYSSKGYKLPSVLGDLQEFFGYEMNRRDVLGKIIVSMPLGENELYGHIGGGLAYNYTMAEYGFRPEKVIVVPNVDINLRDYVDFGPMRESNYGSMGGFFNLKLGYKYAYFVAALAAYKQDYGTYHLFNNHTFNPTGWTIIPSAGLMLNFKIF